MDKLLAKLDTGEITFIYDDKTTIKCDKLGSVIRITVAHFLILYKIYDTTILNITMINHNLVKPAHRFTENDHAACMNLINGFIHLNDSS